MAGFMLMLALWQYTGDGRYYNAAETCLNASYTDSHLKHWVDTRADHISKAWPLPAKTLPIGYQLTIRKDLTYRGRVMDTLVKVHVNKSVVEVGAVFEW